MFLLDTNACIRILNGTSPKLIERLRRYDPAAIRLCSIVKAELYYGARRSSRVEENLQLLKAFYDVFLSIPFDDLCAEHYGSIRCELENAGRPMGPNDLMIAAAARAHDLVLVTHNTREFGRVAGLRLQDWEAEDV